MVGLLNPDHRHFLLLERLLGRHHPSILAKQDDRNTQGSSSHISSETQRAIFLSVPSQVSQCIFDMFSARARPSDLPSSPLHLEEPHVSLCPSLVTCWPAPAFAHCQLPSLSANVKPETTKGGNVWGGTIQTLSICFIHTSTQVGVYSSPNLQVPKGSAHDLQFITLTAATGTE